MSAGEFFDLLRPLFLVLAALLSTWVLADASRRGQRIYYALIWALATLAFPLVVFPIYLLIKLNYVRSFAESRSARQRVIALLLPLIYLLIVLSVIAIARYRESNTADMHLARATHAKLASDRQGTIKEYRAALSLEDSAHTHKLLGVELSDAGEFAAALSEFRLAELGREPDPTLSFRIAQLLDSLNLQGQAAMEYERFIDGEACSGAQPDYRCAIARERSGRSN